MPLIVRDATLEDAEDILAIYNYAAVNTTAVWTDGPVDLDSRRAWIRARRDAGYPVLVAMKGRDVVGFASFGDFRPWPGYRHTVENSVYVDERHHRAGIGRGLMAALIERATALNKHTMVAAIEASNSASIALHASFGFAEVGRMPEVGCKFGRWLDMVLMQMRLSSDVRPKMQIRPGDTFDPRVIALLDHHVTAARAQTAPGSAHALDLAGLRARDIAFWTGWDGETLVATGALKTLSPRHGEVKSMHTLQTARRRGYGGQMLRHIIAQARARGLQRLSLETGSWDYFKPAHALYQAHGFVPCGPFEGYAEDPNSLFLKLDLRG